MGIDLRHGTRAAISIGDLLGSGRDPDTESIGIATAAILQRITRAADPPEPMTDDASDIGRVILAITVERVSSANYITQTA